MTERSCSAARRQLWSASLTNPTNDSKEHLKCSAFGNDTSANRTASTSKAAFVAFSGVFAPLTIEFNASSISLTSEWFLATNRPRTSATSALTASSFKSSSRAFARTTAHACCVDLKRTSSSSRFTRFFLGDIMYSIFEDSPASTPSSEEPSAPMMTSRSARSAPCFKISWTPFFVVLMVSRIFGKKASLLPTAQLPNANAAAVFTSSVLSSSSFFHKLLSMPLESSSFVRFPISPSVQSEMTCLVPSFSLISSISVAMVLLMILSPAARVALAMHAARFFISNLTDAISCCCMRTMA